VAQHERNYRPHIGAVSSLVQTASHDALPNPVVIFDVPITPVNLDRLLSFVQEAVEHASKSTIFFANIHTMNQAYTDHDLKQALIRADLVYCDGEGVRLGARLLGKLLPQRLTGADWIYDLARLCQAGRYRLFLLGGTPGVAEAAALQLRLLYPELQIVGAHHGFFHKTNHESSEIIQMINRLAPDILLVGLSTPIQEVWIRNNRLALNATVVWAMGATMDFVSGQAPRAPKWMCEHGLEWLFRLMFEPRRMWKRYAIGNPLFFFRVIREIFR
jgi:N-acetylglucosaminyldiphosphoundecaprenol N-acetyl-beta-D-mannosaminyltransferase